MLSRSANSLTRLATTSGIRIRNKPTAAAAAFQPLTASEVDGLSVKIRKIVGEANVSVTEAVRNQHSQDEGPHGAKMPDLVVYANKTEEVSEICQACYADGIPIIPYGTGTGLEGGIAAVHGGICIDLSKNEDIYDYNPEDFDVKVRPGVTRESLNHFVKDDGLWFPVDPGANASVCGMCATGASGTNAVKYGTIKENCLNLEVVLADGRILHTGGEGKRPRKSAAGYNLTNLFVGSEGTLGVITGATIKLHAQPEAIASAVVDFPNTQAAVSTVVQILQCAIPVARMELLDRVAVKACNDYSNLDLAIKPTLFLEFHCSESAMENETAIVKDLATDNGGSAFQWAIKQEDRTKLWTARHKLFYAGINMKPGCRAITTDVCVPVSNLPRMIDETRKDLDGSGVMAPLFGHVGDGNFHALLLFDPEDRSSYDACKQVATRMGYRALELGGTCTGEHGVGLGKRTLLREQFGDAGVDTMRAIKMALDPKGIMNPGKIF